MRERIGRWTGLVLASAGCIWVEAAERLPLPQPDLSGGKPLMEVLQLRRSTREFSTNAVSDRVLADLVWAGFGVNRPESGDRTAPSAMNARDVDIYISRRDGLFRYDAAAHALERIHDDDIRGLTGDQEFVRKAPLALIFVSDISRLGRAAPEVRMTYAAVDTGYVSQNIYLFCASEGLATVVHEIGDRTRLAEAMRLRPEQRIILAQAAGYPAAAE